MKDFKITMQYSSFHDSDPPMLAEKSDESISTMFSYNLSELWKDSTEIFTNVWDEGFLGIHHRNYCFFVDIYSWRHWQSIFCWQSIKMVGNSHRSILTQRLTMSF